mmetsp:Transcript_19237/g.27827  ORF Transcript_19237/g.27827 Transcript_19237/m.27827 type:complete len:326 (+) Transcript_19237:90-1067(+)
MSEKIQIIPFRGNTNLVDDLQLIVKESEFGIPAEPTNIDQQSNIRIILDNTASRNVDAMLQDECLVSSSGIAELTVVSDAKLDVKFGNGLYAERIDIAIEEGVYHVTKKVYFERPIVNFPELNAIPIPVDLLTVHIKFEKVAESVSNEDAEPQIDAVFNAYSHLGFFLVDLPRFKGVLQEKYGNQLTDLVSELTTTELVEELFQQEIIMMVWGINPYTYPIYSTNEPVSILPVLGEEFGSVGLYNLDENITELSIIQGSALRNYPDFLNESWSKINIFGEGKKATLKPYQLKDKDGENVVTLFLIQRSSEVLEQPVPLMNVDLLY